MELWIVYEQAGEIVCKIALQRHCTYIQVHPVTVTMQCILGCCVIITVVTD